jgi:hypothetical protein
MEPDNAREIVRVRGHFRKILRPHVAIALDELVADVTAALDGRAEGRMCA